MPTPARPGTPEPLGPPRWAVRLMLTLAALALVVEVMTYTGVFGGRLADRVPAPALVADSLSLAPVSDSLALAPVADSLSLAPVADSLAVAQPAAGDGH
jgi:hypothetical protein